MDGSRFDLRPGRHCEERQRRSNPFCPRGEMDCFAPLAMTIQLHLIARDFPRVAIRAPRRLCYSAAAAVLAGRKAGMTSLANRSRSSSWTSSGVPSGVAHTTRSTPG